MVIMDLKILTCVECKVERQQEVLIVSRISHWEAQLSEVVWSVDFNSVRENPSNVLAPSVIEKNSNKPHENHFILCSILIF